MSLSSGHTNTVIAEILQGLIAIAIVLATILIILYEVVNGKPISVPDVLAGFDGVVITFYFARSGQAQIAQAAANGTAQGMIAGQSSATDNKPHS